MLRTNSAKARCNIRTYIMNSVDKESLCEEFGDNAPDVTFEQVAQLIMKRFRTEKSDTRQVNEFALFTDWTQGLPSVLNCNYYLSCAVDILGDMLEETESERNRYTETAAEQYITRLIYRELINAMG